MMSIPSIALSGMNAAQVALSASAQNVASYSVPGYHRQVVTQTASPDGGVTASIGRSPEEGVSLEADLVGQLAAKNQFLANLAVFRTSQQMFGSLLDVTG